MDWEGIGVISKALLTSSLQRPTAMIAVPVELLADAPLQLLVVPLYLALDPVQVGGAGALGRAPRILSNQVQVVQGRVCK